MHGFEKLSFLRRGVTSFFLVSGLALRASGAATEEPASARSFPDLRLRSIGPAVMGGRIDDVEVVASRPTTLYVGSASGGVWKSTNQGTTWTSIFDDEETSSIGDVAVAPSDPDIVWVGTGEPNNRQSSSFGSGIYKSEDAGRSFTRVGLEATGHIGKVLVHPREPGHVFVAALGPLWSASPERGVYRTLDGGKRWEKVLYVDESTGAVTMAMDPENPDVLYAALYQRQRVPWGFSGGGPGSGLYKSTDGGDSWRKLGNGLPGGVVGRIGIDVFRRDPRVVYAIVEHATEGGVYRSSDRGESWQKLTSFNPRPMYYSQIYVDPGDDKRVYVLGSSFHVSDDGGRTFVENEEMTPTYDVGVHGDHHTLWIDPSSSDHLVLGNDGGLYFSWDRGRSWDKVNNFPLAQFYSVAVDMAEPYNVYAGAQDTHSWSGPSATRNQAGILNGDWVQIHFGDGMYQQADPTDPSTVYTSSQDGNVIRLDRRTGDRKSIKPYPGEGEDGYRFNWTSPLLVSAHDPRTVYLGGNRLFISQDHGDSWTASADLTWHEDRDELPIMGVVPDETTLSRNDGVDAWGTITTIAESPLDANVLYVGTDDGRLQLSRDRGRSFESLESRLPGLDPRRAAVSRIAPSHAAVGRAYVSLDRHQMGDFAPYVFVTEDFGKSFRGLSKGLPTKGWVNVVLEDPRNPDLLFVGTETGLFLSFDRGATFLRMTGNFPTVPVDDVVIHPRDHDLVVATHGRSIYILDDVTPLERHRPGGDAVELFDPRPATAFLPWKNESYGGQRRFAGENPAFGALVTYYLEQASASADPVRLSVLGPDGKRVRELEGPSEAGFHRLAWDLRASAPEGVKGGRGPLVPPGRYRIELAIGSESRASVAEVVYDPRLSTVEAEAHDRYEFLTGVNALESRLFGAVTRATALDKQLESALAVIASRKDEEAENGIRSAREEIDKARKPIGGGTPSFREPSLSAQASALAGELEGGGVQQGTLHGPTPVQRERLSLLEKKSEAAIAHLEEVSTRVLAGVNERLRVLGPLQIVPGGEGGGEGGGGPKS
jgi:photosystem II stability/assembly factor-like uncharacterized protein